MYTLATLLIAIGVIFLLLALLAFAGVISTLSVATALIVGVICLVLGLALRGRL